MPNMANHTKENTENATPKKRGERRSYIDKIVDVGLLVHEQPKPNNDEMAFLSRVLTQAFLPHSDPKEIMWTRTNGNLTLDVKSGIGRGKDGKPKLFGIPYGSIPRILLAYISTEALRNSKNPKCGNPRIISLGKSLSEFLEKLDIHNSGGKRGGITSFKKQAERLFHSEITVTYRGQSGIAERDIKISDGRFIFWDLKEPTQQSLWESYIEISDRFYEFIIRNPVPLDWRVLKEVKQSPMALDLYIWLVPRMKYLHKPSFIKWETLQEQMGANISNIRHFRSKVRQHIKKIQFIWRDLDVDASGSEHIVLYPSPELIPETKPRRNKKALV